MADNNKKNGTREWAESNVNFITGCTHNCKYCYSKEMSVRFKRTTPESWANEIVRQEALNKTYRKSKGRIMFPSSHDITPFHLNDALTVLRGLLESDNQVLIVSKPHLECVKSICTTFIERRSQILFRFTIGSANTKTLKFWEPNAPSFTERLNSLKYAFAKGFHTSVSCEPMLDNKVGNIIEKVLPLVTETIWIGKANNLIARMKINGITDKETLAKARQLVKWQSNTENILLLYDKYKMNPKIKWKDSISSALQKNKFELWLGN